MEKKNKTICAISTPPGAGGISIIRVSGDDSLKIASQIFSSKNKDDLMKNPRKMILGKLKTKVFTDNCLAVYFKSPNSYTGEDMIEFQCHGGSAVSEGVLNAVIDAGAILAEAGEFTKRAFVNGKLSLDEAEGVIDIINSESESEVRAGTSLLNGNLKNQIEKMQNVLTTLLAKVEVSIDYPEEELEDETSVEVKDELIKIKKDCEEILFNSKTGVKVKSGYRVGIIGKTNVGKSSLLNAMLNYNKAIVTNISGTTRDLVEDTYVYNGVKFNLIDSAGIRETDDIVEKIGIEKSRELIDASDIILFVIDGSVDIENEEIEIISRLTNKNAILIVNKSDLFNKEELLPTIQKFWNKELMFISAKELKGIVDLKDIIFNMLIDKKILNSLLLTNVRHIDLIKKAVVCFDNAIKAIDNGLTLDMVSIDMQDAWSCLGEVTGTSNTEEIVNTIFSKFCVGK